MAEQRQDTLNKRKVFTRSDAVVGDDENKEELSIKQAESPKKQLFRDLSYADSMGIDVLRFVENTLHKNAKDREFLLFIEEETRKFVEDESKSYHWFPPTSSYNRMLIHRVAAFFGLIHNVDQSGQQVVITKQKGHTRIPDIKFSSLIKHSNFEDKFHFGRRNVQSFDESNISTLCNHRSTTNFGGPPPSSYRPFRNRFYTSGGSQFNNNNNKSRRTRSFEISDWTNSSSTTLFNQQQQQQFAAWLQPSNLEIVTAGGGEGMSTSNCSSSASSGAVIHHQMAVGGNGSCGGGGGIPFQIYPTGQILLTNEPSLISPTSAFSEPIITNNQQQQQLPPIIQSTNGIVEKKQQRSQIPSLFSIQPLMSPPIMPSPNTTATNILPNQQQYINPYMALQYQYQPMMINNAANPAAQYQYFTDNANILHYYPTYYPIYQPHQQQTFIDPYHPLIEENDNNNTRPSIIENQFESLSINQETTPPKCNNNGNNNKNNNNGVGKPSTCY
uniref:R3H domain-containing protein n=1 Tax=Meloidogyne incognita TaxID=6306 RepID=A0A914M9K4_MELIC